jgi:hypothetical protein
MNGQVFGSFSHEQEWTDSRSLALGMPWSGPDWGSDPDRTEPHLRCSVVWGVVLKISTRCSLGFVMGWVSCAPGLNETAP